MTNNELAFEFEKYLSFNVMIHLDCNFNLTYCITPEPFNAAWSQTAILNC